MTDIRDTSEKLLERLKSALIDNELESLKSVVMHDFSLDRMVRINNFHDFFENAKDVYKRGGGLLPDSTQKLQQGGCAANTATTLAKLGIDSYFIGRTDSFGMEMMRFYLEKQGVDISHVKLDGKTSFVTCIEIGNEKHNIMVNDKESFSDFGFDDLDDDDLNLIDSADIVGVFDWCLNSKGTELAERLFNYLHEKGVKTYFDTSDPTPRKGEIVELYGNVFTNPGLSNLCLNENELRIYSGAGHEIDSLDELIRLAINLRSGINPDLTVHTAKFALDINDSITLVPTINVTPQRATGAGDTWNGGNILGLLLQLAPEERLLLANATAGFYVESLEGNRPNLKELITFIESCQDRFNIIESEVLEKKIIREVYDA